MSLVLKVRSRVLLYLSLLVIGVQGAAARVFPLFRSSQALRPESSLPSVERGLVLHLNPRPGWHMQGGRTYAIEMTSRLPYFGVRSLRRGTVPVPMELVASPSRVASSAPTAPLIYQANSPLGFSPTHSNSAPQSSPSPQFVIVGGSCLSCVSCFSCGDCSSCTIGTCVSSCASCASCQACGNCDSCGGCGSCANCGGCSSCAGCGGCGGCAGCNDCIWVESY